MTAFSTVLANLASATSFIYEDISTSSGTDFCGRISNLDEDHGGDLLGGETLGLAEVLNLNGGVALVVNDLEGPALHILLDGGLIELATDQTPVNGGQRTAGQTSPGASLQVYILGVENGVGGVKSSLVLGSITDQALLLGEGNERRGNTVSLLVGDCDIGQYAKRTNRRKEQSPSVRGGLTMQRTGSV